MDLGQRIKKARENLGLSQDELAARVGVVVRSVRNWESNSGRITTPNIHKLERALNIQLRDGTGVESPRLNEATDDEIWTELRNRKTALLKRIADLEARQ